MKESRANELFVWSKKLKLAVHERKELFLKRRFPQTGIVADSRHGLINFLLEEIECNVFLGPEIVEDSAFGDSRFARNLFGSRCVEAFCLKQIQGGGDDTFSDRLLGLRTSTGRTRVKDSP